MKTKILDSIHGKMISRAAVVMATPSNPEGDSLELSFTDGTAVSIMYAPSLPEISVVNNETEEVATLRATTTVFHE